MPVCGSYFDTLCPVTEPMSGLMFELINCTTDTKNTSVSKLISLTELKELLNFMTCLGSKGLMWKLGDCFSQNRYYNIDNDIKGLIF